MDRTEVVSAITTATRKRDRGQQTVPHQTTRSSTRSNGEERKEAVRWERNKKGEGKSADDRKTRAECRAGGEWVGRWVAEKERLEKEGWEMKGQQRRRAKRKRN